MPQSREWNPIPALLEAASTRRVAIVGTVREDTPAAAILDQFLDELTLELVEPRDAALILAVDDQAPLPDDVGAFVVAIGCERDDAHLHVDAEQGGFSVVQSTGERLTLLPFPPPPRPGAIAVVTDSAWMARQIVHQLAARDHGAALICVASPGEVEPAHWVDLAARHDEVAVIILARETDEGDERLQEVIARAGVHVPIVFYPASDGSNLGWMTLPVVPALSAAQAASMAIVLSRMDPPAGVDCHLIGGPLGLRRVVRWLASNEEIELGHSAVANHPTAYEAAIARLDGHNVAVLIGTWETLQALCAPYRVTPGAPLRLALLDAAGPPTPEQRDEIATWAHPVFTSIEDLVSALQALTTWELLLAEQ